MTHVDGPPPVEPDVRRELSPWAVLALFTSLFVLCPFSGVFGIFLGLRAVQEIRWGRANRGMRLARAAILIGIVTTILWVIGGIWWNRNVRIPMIAGPIDAVQAGQRGDVAAFHDAFTTNQTSDAQAQAFLRELTLRYGLLLSSRQDDLFDAAGGVTTETGVRIPYLFAFESGAVRGEASFAMPAMRFQMLVLRDEELGDLVWPPDAVVGERLRAADADDDDDDGDDDAAPAAEDAPRADDDAP